MFAKDKRRILAIALLMLSSVCLPGRCADDEGDDGDEDDGAGTDTECHPMEAESCFDDVGENLLCQVQSPKARHCEDRTAADLCAGIDDALNCTSDIIDTDCSEAEGRTVFDNWLVGLRGAHKRLCGQKDYELLNRLIKRNNCWNVKMFLRCIENKANITHISDLLTTELSQQECNLLQMAVSICNDKAEKGRAKCRGQADAVNEAVAAFFASSVCAGETPPICSVLAAKNEPLVDKDPAQSTSSSSTAAGISILLTLLVTIVLVALITFLLVKRNVITVNTKFRRMQDGDEGEVQENVNDYGRFL